MIISLFILYRGLWFAESQKNENNLWVILHRNETLKNGARGFVPKSDHHFLLRKLLV
jgi:hypothetical protein